MRAFEIKDKKRLNDYVSGREHASFLQSWEWGEFQKNSGAEIYRAAVEEGGSVHGAVTFIKRKLPLGKTYFYCPRGPVIDQGVGSIMPLFSEIEKIVRRHRGVFLRFEPLNEIMNYPFKEMKVGEMNIIKTLDIQPSETIILDLSESEDELLKAMHQKTRYNIRLAEKKGVRIKEIKDGKIFCDDDNKEKEVGFDAFWNLMKKTSGRDKFTPHPKEYYEELLKTAPETFKLYAAVYEKKIIACGIFVFFGDTATYLYGASDDEHRNVMAPFLLQWEMIRKAQGEHFKYYDFFGISEKKWPGVTRFKRGFGGEEKKYPGTFDVVFDDAHYKIYQVLRRARRLFR